jgi:spore coat protein JB
MYSYERNLDYYNYENNNYNKPLFTKNENANNLYEPYNGFIRGNLFSNLYNGYKIEPQSILASSEKMKLLVRLDALCFAKEDLNLYLDIYPNDRDLIELFNQYRAEAEKVLNEYENKYGPIFVDSSANTAVPWLWDDEPWPWENK